jgi:diguanylate cyclase
MAVANEPDAPEAALVKGIRRHLDGLKRTPDGAALYMLIERGLKRYAGDGGRMEQAFLRFVHSLLERYALDPANDPVTRVKARLIVQRVALHLPDLADRDDVSAVASVAANDPPPADDPPPRARGTAAPKPVMEPVPDVPETLEPLQQTLAEKVTETITFNKEFEALAQNDRQALDRTDKAIADFTDLKQLLVKGLDDLIRERTELKERLSSAADYVRAVEADRKQLRAEVGKLRKHSSADELTGLPRREVFVRSLEAELGRVRRYGFSLALVVLDVDRLEAVNQKYGRAAGDAVLRSYATEVLSGFRTYDLVARYGDDEFAVLFPNTQKEGAMRAIEKAQKRVAETFLTHDGRSFPMPGFSSVLTLYSPGEKATALLARAADALDQAKRTGSGRIVVALPTA